VNGCFLTEEAGKDAGKLLELVAVDVMAALLKYLYLATGNHFGRRIGLPHRDDGVFRPPHQQRRHGNLGQPARETTWLDVRDVEPEQLLLMPCGFDAPRTADEWRNGHASRPAWIYDLAAVQAGEVYALDGSAYFSRPGPRVIDGIATLAELFDPGNFEDEVPAGAWLPVDTPARRA